MGKRRRMSLKERMRKACRTYSGVNENEVREALMHNKMACALYYTTAYCPKIMVNPTDLSLSTEDGAISRLWHCSHMYADTSEHSDNCLVWHPGHILTGGSSMRADGLVLSNCAESTFANGLDDNKAEALSRISMAVLSVGTETCITKANSVSHKEGLRRYIEYKMAPMMAFDKKNNNKPTRRAKAAVYWWGTDSRPATSIEWQESPYVVSSPHHVQRAKALKQCLGGNEELKIMFASTICVRTQHVEDSCDIVFAYESGI